MNQGRARRPIVFVLLSVLSLLASSCFASHSSPSEELVLRAFKEVFGHGPVTSISAEPTRVSLRDRSAHKDLWSNQKTLFHEWVMRQEAERKSYQDLRDKLTDDFVTEAFNKIFVPTVFPPGLVLTQLSDLKEKIRQGVSDGSIDIKGMSRGEAIWTYVALSNSIHGAARTQYPAQSSNGSHIAICVGGVGYNCDGLPLPAVQRELQIPPVEARRSGRFSTKDGRLMEYIQLPVAVGSILHDAACTAQPAGAFCGDSIGVKTDFATHLPSETIQDPSVGAGAEWNKALENVATHRSHPAWSHGSRTWPGSFGPYPIEADRRGEYSDDVRLMANRAATLGSPPELTIPAILAHHATDAHGGENLSSRRLTAPDGTPMDLGDQAYCQSLEFAQTVDEEALGICGKGATPSSGTTTPSSGTTQPLPQQPKSQPKQSQPVQTSPTQVPFVCLGGVPGQQCSPTPTPSASPSPTLSVTPGPSPSPRPTSMPYQLTIDPSAWSASHWDVLGPTYEGNPMIAQYGATHTHVYGNDIGYFNYLFDLHAGTIASAQISARLSSNFAGYSAPSDGFSDVVLYVNANAYAPQRVIPDNGSGQVYVWQINPADLRSGARNELEFWVPANAAYHHGLCIYWKAVAPSFQDEPIRINIVPR